MSDGHVRPIKRLGWRTRFKVAWWALRGYPVMAGMTVQLERFFDNGSRAYYIDDHFIGPETGREIFFNTDGHDVPLREYAVDYRRTR